MGKCQRVQCPFCKETFGQEVKFNLHIKTKHNVADSKQLYIDTNCSGIHPTCQCSKECNVFLAWGGWKKGFTSKYARGHNARIDSVYFDMNRQREFSEKRTKGYASGSYSVWNKGLTSETDSRVAEMSTKISQTLTSGYETGRIVDWRCADVDKAKEVAKKISQTKKLLYDAGTITPWNKGLTKEDDERIASVGCKISENYKINPSSSSKRLTSQEFLSRVNNVEEFDLISDPATYTNKYQKFVVKCKSCGTTQKKNLMMLENSPVCFSCKPKESKGQIEIYEFIRTLSKDAILSDRSTLNGRELDIFIPEKKIAIEYNGLYWHSESVLSEYKTYHEKKSKDCLAAGVRLIHIFEDEWKLKRQIVESILRNSLGFSNRLASARECLVKEINNEERREFFEANHLDGDARSTCAFGLFYDKALVAAISLRKPFHSSDKERLEVCRFATKLNSSIPGALGKLTKVAIEKASKDKKLGLMTYVDTRLGRGSSYLLAGYKLDDSRKSSPRFWWTDYIRRFDRFKYRADKSRGLTQAQVAEEAGVVQIFGCSNLVYFIDLT